MLPHIRDWGIDTLLILSGDHLYHMDYREFLKRHDDTNADVTVSVIPCTYDLACDFGLLKTDPTGRITEFREKPKGDSLEAMRVDTTSFGKDRPADSAHNEAAHKKNRRGEFVLEVHPKAQALSANTIEQQ